MVKRDLHIARVWAMGLISTHRPLLVQMIPMRRCNLACAYCNEYDNFSKPVPLDVMTRRIDKVASFGTAMIGISGGEPSGCVLTLQCIDKSGDGSFRLCTNPAQGISGGEGNVCVLILQCLDESGDGSFRLGTNPLQGNSSEAANVCVLILQCFNESGNRNGTNLA